jgi:phage tail sheath protein FI
MMQVVPAGTTIAAAVTAKGTAGLDSYASKLLHGDWLWWNDQVNGVTRLVSPQGFAAGRLANLSPEQSSLNKQLYGVVGSQKSGVVGSPQQQAYSSADLQTLFQAGIDVISNPQPGGSYWGLRCGHNSSSNSGTNGDNYTRMTNYIAATLNAGMGKYVGQVVNASLFQRIRSTLASFLANLLQQGLLGTTDGSLPYSVVCDTSNNPASRTGLGYVQADVQVRYQAINEKFLVNIEGGQTVQVLKQQTQPVAA